MVYSIGSANQQGGAQSDYSVSIIGDSASDFTSVQSLRILLPSEFNMGSGLTLTCESQGGFSAAPSCKTIGANELVINMDNAQIGTASIFVVLIKNVINPLFETGTFSFTFELVSEILVIFVEKCY